MNERAVGGNIGRVTCVSIGKQKEMNTEYSEALKRFIRRWVREHPEGSCFDCWSEMDHQLRIVLVPDAFVVEFERIQGFERFLAEMRKGCV